MFSVFFQFKEFLGTYNKVTENCFMDCVKDFTTRDVKPEEVKTHFYVFHVGPSSLWLYAGKSGYKPWQNLWDHSWRMFIQLFYLNT